MMASGVPHLYHRLEHDGQVEILTTPYYHPILPLIIDSRSALRGDPKAILPDPPFAYPDDAAFQIEEAIASHERAFGQKPRGMWPSEGSIPGAYLSRWAPYVRTHGPGQGQLP